MANQLSPAAQAVEDAYFSAAGFGYRNGLAAALRAAAADGCHPSWGALTVLRHLHSIADELEAL